MRPVAKGKFVSLGSCCERHQLSPETNPEGGLMLAHGLADNFYGLIAAYRVAWTVGYENTIIFFISEIIIVRNTLDTNRIFQQGTQDIFFHSAINGDNQLISRTIHLRFPDRYFLDPINLVKIL